MFDVEKVSAENGGGYILSYKNKNGEVYIMRVFGYRKNPMNGCVEITTVPFSTFNVGLLNNNNWVNNFNVAMPIHNSELNLEANFKNNFYCLDIKYSLFLTKLRLSVITHFVRRNIVALLLAFFVFSFVGMVVHEYFFIADECGNIEEMLGDMSGTDNTGKQEALAGGQSQQNDFVPAEKWMPEKQSKNK